MRIVFISGPLWAPWWGGRLLNIVRAARVAWRYSRAGNVVICPHTNTGYLSLIPFCGQAIESSARWLDGYLEILTRLDPARDQVHFLRRWELSNGSSLEWRKAQACGLKCSYDQGATQALWPRGDA